MTKLIAKASDMPGECLYAPNEIEKMLQTLHGLEERGLNLITSMIEFPYRSTKAREYAVKGFSRRAFTIHRCIANVFRLLPPYQIAIPRDLTDVEINLQSFVANAFGALDNMAWVWACENSERTGAPLPARFAVGLREKNKDLRLTLSEEFARLLDDCSDWLRYLEDYRDSLAHRVPLYVVPYIVSLENGPEYDRLGRLIEIAATGDDHEGYTALRYSQSQLMEFKPVMIHSIDEAVGHIPFHRQMLDDFFTLETIAMKMLEDMQSKLTSGAWRS